jgi:superfamily II DNA or RNA helicase/very-short-patch-repair endonuclease
MSEQTGLIHRLSPPEVKIALFRSLFRGREDVYPRRFESKKTGKSGYQPACGNEWAPGVCEKPRIQCAACRHQLFFPVTDQALRWHLSGCDDSGGDFVIGVYPLLRDETCFFVAARFDKADWQDDAQAVIETCRRIDVSASLERSRSGKAGHIWLFFEEAIPAVLARKLGAYILTEAMEHRPDLGLDSYDRLVPNQDTLPHNSFGSAIALPLQKQPREAGNSVFLDDQHVPHADQWAFLASIRRIDRAAVDRIVGAAERRGRIVGVRPAPAEEAAPSTSRNRSQIPLSGPLPDRIEITLDDQIYIPKASLPSGLHNRLVRLAAFENPEFLKAQAMRVPAYDKPRIVSCAEQTADDIALPRGCLSEVLELFEDLRVAVVLRDERNAGKPLDVQFQGSLLPGQSIAAADLLSHDIGVLSATTAFGKTVVAAWLIAQRGVNTLVLVHRRQLQEQWVERLSAFLGLPRESIGRIGGGRRKPTGSLDVAIIQSLVRKGKVSDLLQEYGHMIVDECHHLSAQSFEQVVRRARAKYVTGLSATVIRKDGRHPIVFMQCGPIRHRVDPKAQALARPFTHAVYVRPTGFRPSSAPVDDVRIQFQELYGELIADQERNQRICDDVVEAAGEGRSPLVLTERNDHLDMLEQRLASGIRHLVVLRGGMGRTEAAALSARLAAIPECEPRALLATGRLVGEGFDDSRLDTLFLTLPVSWHGTVAQYVGRLHRLHAGKREVRVIDYADLDVPMFARMFDRRCRGYEAVGYQILLPASAVPGWPVEVPLPVDPQWKTDYAASVRRLVRDGVDRPLASQFVDAARQCDPDGDGVARARSATEAFFYRRLETLPETLGRFRLNAELPIPFDGCGQMEVDLLCADARVAIELDGAQHLDGEEAYRRDRRKDQLLQEHGYFVLRFLATDVGRHLDAVLDTVLRTLAHRARDRDSASDDLGGGASSPPCEDRSAQPPAPEGPAT